MTTVDQAARGAAILGRLAAIRGTGLTSCPYPLDGTSVQRAAARVWVRTYLALRPRDAVQVDETDDLLALAHGPDDPDDPAADADAPGKGH